MESVSCSLRFYDSKGSVENALSSLSIVFLRRANEEEGAWEKLRKLLELSTRDTLKERLIIIIIIEETETAVSAASEQ